MIEVSGLSKTYGKVRAVDDVTFTVKPGIVTGFLGPNGAGKSTTMRMIVGLDRPTAGTATIDGARYSHLQKPLHKVGALLDAKSWHPNRSARARLNWIAKSNGIGTRRVDEVLELVGMTDAAKRNCGNLSLGMGQRLGLATALLGDPEILILDEPVNGLDPEGIRWVRRFLKRLAGEGRTVFVSSHLLSEMALTADHLIVIGRGKLVSDSSTHDFVRQAQKVSTLVRTPNTDVFAQVLREENLEFTTDTDPEGHTVFTVQDATTEHIGELAYTTGILLHQLEEKTASLEDAFLKMTGHTAQFVAADGDDPQAPAQLGDVPPGVPLRSGQHSEPSQMEEN